MFYFTLSLKSAIMIIESWDDMADSRTKKSILNSMTSIITQIILVVMNFVVKTIFIQQLGSVYLGVNGLFSNIITMLSLADLGIGIAIPYSLYKPLAEKNHKKINILMNFYAKIYNTIGTIVLVFGLSLIPFLGFFIKGGTVVPNIELLYALFVIHSASSYFFVYKRFLIESDQKGYITTRISFFFSVLLNIVQGIILIAFQNFIFYLVSSVILVIIQNVYISHKAMRLYPYLKNKTKEKMDPEDLEDIKKNISALFIYKIGSVITNGTDNLVISKFIGIVAVGVYSNYIMIVNSVNNIVIQLFNAITSSIGNLVVTTNERRSKAVYECLTFLNFWIYALCSILLCVLFNPFIEIWIGKDYLLSNMVVWLLSINFYLVGMGSVTNSFRNAYGLFWKGKYRPVAMIIINLVVSILLVKPLGITGVLIGTIVSRLTTVVWMDPHIVYEYGFKRSSTRYFIKYVIFLLLFLVVNGICFSIVNLLPSGFLWLMVKGILTFLIVNIIYFGIFHDTGEFHYFYDKLIGFIARFRQKRKGIYDTI